MFEYQGVNDTEGLTPCRVVDWATMASIAVTGVVGIAGVGGANYAAKISGKSATKAARLSLTGESDRARLAEKRRIYARAIAAAADRAAGEAADRLNEASPAGELRAAAARVGPHAGGRVVGRRELVVSCRAPQPAPFAKRRVPPYSSRSEPPFPSTSYL
jgi:hypothetical protein